MLPTFDTLTVPYAELPDGTRLRAVVRRPFGEGPFPCLLDFHGGAWTHFDASVDFNFCEALTERGYVTVSVDFRLAPEHPYPAFLEDARAALRFVDANAATFGIDRRAIGAIGGSTGGHIAVLLGLMPSAGRTPTAAYGAAHDRPVGLAFAVGLYPILDVPGRYAMAKDARFSLPATTLAGALEERLARAARRDGVTGTPKLGSPTPRLRVVQSLRKGMPALGDAVGDGLQRLLERVGRVEVVRAFEYPHLVTAHEGAFRSLAHQREASPLHVVREGRAERLPPILVLQGEHDPNLTPAMTRAFEQAYRASGGAIDVRIREGYAHGFGAIPSRLVDAAVEEIDAFARQQLRSATSATERPRTRGLVH